MSTFGRIINGVSAIVLACAGVLAHAQDADTMAQARELLKAKRGADAYRLLKPMAEARAGDPEFDLLYGMAAIDAGKPTEGTFALERVLDADPNNAAAQAELGRAYYEMGENAAAKQQFEQAKGEKLPPGVQENIDRYLNAIDNRGRAARTQYRAYVEVGAGYDNNVNSATDSQFVSAFSPAVSPTPFITELGPSALAQDSVVWTVDTGFGFISPLATPWALFGGINLQHRANIDDTVCASPEGDTSCSTSAADGNIGLQYTPTEVDRYRVSTSAQRFYVGGEPNRDLGALNADYTRALTKRDQVSVSGQFGMFRFPGQNSRNVNRYLGGAGWSHAFGGHYRPVMFLSAYGGTEDDVEDNPGGVARDLFGMRVGGEVSVVPKARAFASLTYQKSLYDSATPFFGPDDREDDYLRLNGGVRYNLTKMVSIRPEVSYTTNDSNVAITDFDRWEGLVYFRSDF